MENSYARAQGDSTNLSGLHPLIGIASAICGNLVISIALNIQRYAHLQLRCAPPPSNVSEEEQGGTPSAQHLKPNYHGGDDSSYNQTTSMAYLRSRWWWLGFFLMALGETGNFVAYGLAPASVVSPLGVIALVSNCIVAPIFFNERVSRQHIKGVIITVLGILLIITSVQTMASNTNYFAILPRAASSSPSPHTSIRFAISQTAFQVYMVIVLLLIAALLLQTTYLEPDPPHIFNLFSNLGLVALFGALTVLCTKGLSSILNYSLSEALRDPLTYALTAFLALTAIAQVIYLNRALKLFDATLVLPVHFVLFTISVIIGSEITYHDFEYTDPVHFTLFFAGCLLTFYGVWLITSSPSNLADSPRAGSPETQPLLPEPAPVSYVRRHYKRLSDYSVPSSNLLPPPSTGYGHSYSNSLPVLPSSISSSLLVPSTGTSAVSFFKPYITDDTSTAAAGNSIVPPIHSYLALTHENMVNSPMALTSSGFFIGTAILARRSLRLLELFQRPTTVRLIESLEAEQGFSE